MTRPTLLCMDEPSMGLAPRLVEEVFDIIRAINEQGTTIFVIEQNVNMALSIAHRGYVLQMGEVVLTGSAKSCSKAPYPESVSRQRAQDKRVFRDRFQQAGVLACGTDQRCPNPKICATTTELPPPKSDTATGTRPVRELADRRSGFESLGFSTV